MLLDAVVGEVACLSAAPYMGLVIGPSGDRFTSPANILVATRTGDDIDSINSFAVDWPGDGEPSFWLVGGEDDCSKVAFFAHLAGAPRSLVEASWGCLTRWRSEWITS